MISFWNISWESCFHGNTFNVDIQAEVMIFHNKDITKLSVMAKLLKIRWRYTLWVFHRPNPWIDFDKIYRTSVHTPQGNRENGEK